MHEEAEKEKTELLEKQKNELRRLLEHHQEEKGEWKEAHQTEIERFSQDVKIQVGAMLVRIILNLSLLC